MADEPPTGALFGWECPACSAEMFWVYDPSVPATHVERCSQQNVEVTYRITGITMSQAASMTDVISFLNVPVYECPADGCDWQLSQLDYERNRPTLQASVRFEDGNPRLDVSEMMVANAKYVDRLLRDHAETHDVADWIKTIQRLNKEIYENHREDGDRG